ncbi:MAG: AGE family epimerase/isomerase [Shewanella sp.]|nr:AGE family epimerase/isomerase [Shewanella sp.]
MRVLSSPYIDTGHGGYYQQFDNHGQVSTGDSPGHLVSSSRLTINFAVAAQIFDDDTRDDYLMAALHGVNYLRSHHFNEQTGGYAWLVEQGDRECSLFTHLSQPCS